MNTGLSTSLLPSIRRFIIPTFPRTEKVTQKTVNSFVYALNRNVRLNWGDLKKDYYPFELDYGSRYPKVIYSMPRNLPEGWHVVLHNGGFIKTAQFVVSSNGEVFTCNESGTRVDKKIGHVNDLLKTLKDSNTAIADQMYRTYKAKYGLNIAGYDWIP